MATWCKNIPTVIAFTGKNWCFHCKNIEPQLEKLRAIDGVSIHFAQFDVERGASDSFHDLFKISSYPTLMVYCPKVNKYFIVTARTAVEIEHFARDKVGSLTSESECELFAQYQSAPKECSFLNHTACGKLQL